MDWIQILIIAFLLFIVLTLIFKRYITALIYDYGVDFGFSFAGSFFMGLGFIGFDIGGFIAAILIYKKEKKITNTFFAGFVAWEATNFFPFSFIPGLGLFTNFFPAVTLGRLVFNKFGDAEEKEKKIEQEILIAEQVGVEVSKQKKGIIEIKKLIKAEDPVDALSKEEQIDKELLEKMNKYVDKLICDVENVIRTILNQDIQAPQESINILQEAINMSEELLRNAKKLEEKGDFEGAITNTKDAKNIIINAVEQFDNRN
jgi:hypothetical protein